MGFVSISLFNKMNYIFYQKAQANGIPQKIRDKKRQKLNP